jgi:hypothetical protein
VGVTPHEILRVFNAIAYFDHTGCKVPASSPQPARPSGAAAAPDARRATVNLDEIFPPGRGRELLLNNCTTCHTFVPIVILQMTKEAWERNSRDHRGRVASLSDADFKILYEYLIANFNPNRPVPKLPQELLNTWTAY